MHLSQVLEHYKLEEIQLIRILIANKLFVDLRSVDQVPEDWFPILSRTTHINPPELKSAVPEYEIARLTTYGIRQALHLNTTKLADEEVEEVETIVARAESLKGLTVLGKIELPDINKTLPSEKITESHHEPNKRNKNQGREKVKKEYFWAYVKFVVPEKGYGFAKRIHDLNNIIYSDLLTKDDNDDYYIKVEDGQVKGEQLILCSSRSDLNGKKKASIESVYFTGIIKDKGRLRKVFDLSSRLCPQGFGLVSGSLQKFAADTELSFTIELDNGKFNAKDVVDRALEGNINEFGNIAAFKRLSKKDNLTEDETELIQVLNATIKDREEILKVCREPFAKEKAECIDTTDETAIDNFLDKWLLLCPELVSAANLDFKVGPDYYMDRWLKKGLPNNFWGIDLYQACWHYVSECKPTDALPKFINLKRILSSPFPNEFNSLLYRYLNNIVVISSADEFISYKKIADTTAESNIEILEAELLNKLEPMAKLELWLAGETQIFPRKEAMELFSTCITKEQDQIAGHLDDSELGSVSKYLTLGNNAAILQRGREIIEQDILEQFGACSLDIESDGENINELAWGNREQWFSGDSREAVADLIETLQNIIIDANPLLVGHNIMDFDVPVLEKQGLRVISEQLWDTLQVEMVLSPGFRYYALQTKHHALEDAKLTIKLFLNQVLRILSTDEGNWQLIRHIFTPAIQEIIAGFRSAKGFEWLRVPELNEERLSFFRPQPRASTLLTELKEKLEASAAGVKVILASSEFWEELRTVPNLVFFTSESSGSRFWELDEEALLNQLRENSFEWVVVKRFFNHCNLIGLSPLMVNLPPVVKVRLSEKIDFALCLKKVPTPDWNVDQVACLNIRELADQEESLLKAENTDIFVVEPDLISLTFKMLLKETDLHHVIQNEVTEHLWIKFSGGQSFIEINREQAKNLNVVVPDGITNFWIEKYVYGKYRIWGNYNWKHHLEGFPPESIHVIERKKEAFPISQASYLFVDQKKLQNTIGITRFNPETIYRSRYWLIQQELIAGIIRMESKMRPLVLFIQRRDEIAILEQYFFKLGYYIPENEIGIGRRLELLHQSKRSHKILIAPVSEASYIIGANYLGPLNIALDSFNLYEGFFLAKGSKLFDKSVTASAEIQNDIKRKGQSESNEEDDLSNNQPVGTGSFLQRDIYFLLKLQLPFIDRLRSLMIEDDKENKLWILDARIEDFASLGDVWRAKKEVIKGLWEDVEHYERDAKVADACIRSPKPEADLPFSVKDAKDILAKVFLPAGRSWYPYQHDYLDKILPAQTNLLVSLPTGGGKSLLFQAPALYRSSFTNRLTIVITPLKALMEDQVKNLWKLGFYGSVDYINQDKSEEVQHIYRRLAGGELSLLFITPERFRSGGFIKAFAQRLKIDGGLEYAVYDEAHCISQWGHEFRPDYLYSGKEVQRYKNFSERSFPVLLFSATVSERVYRDFNLIFK